MTSSIWKLSEWEQLLGFLTWIRAVKITLKLWLENGSWPSEYPWFRVGQEGGWHDCTYGIQIQSYPELWRTPRHLSRWPVCWLFASTSRWRRWSMDPVASLRCPPVNGKYVVLVSPLNSSVAPHNFRSVLYLIHLCLDQWSVNKWKMLIVTRVIFHAKPCFYT